MPNATRRRARLRSETSILLPPSSRPMSRATRQYPGAHLNQASTSLMQQNGALHQTFDTTFRGQARSHPALPQAELAWGGYIVAMQDHRSIQSSRNADFVTGNSDYGRENRQILSAHESIVMPGPVGDTFEDVDYQAPMPKTPRIPYRELSPERLSPLPSQEPLMNFQVSTSSAARPSSSQQAMYTDRLHQVLCAGSRLQGVNILTDGLFKYVPNEVLHTLATTPPVCEVRIVLRKDWGAGTVTNYGGVTVGDVLRGLSDYLKTPLPWNSIVTRDIERAAGWREGLTGTHQDVVRGVDLLERRVRFGGFADYGDQYGWVLGLITFAPTNA
ncbi:hypothetical protein DL96DRAFT_1821933 [Flagelloscypha sp. PMI_526]|nr:hypothetical protein DL96DRAFT_1821933 [Flagelloscypha sp. PMI_526]